MLPELIKSSEDEKRLKNHPEVEYLVSALRKGMEDIKTGKTTEGHEALKGAEERVLARLNKQQIG